MLKGYSSDHSFLFGSRRLLKYMNTSIFLLTGRHQTDRSIAQLGGGVGKYSFGWPLLPGNESR